MLALGVRPEEAHYLQGALLLGQGRPEESVASLTEAIRLFPYYADAYQKRSYPLLMLSRYDEALADADRALELWPASFEALLYRGTVRLARQEADGARADFLQAAELDPARAEPHESLGALYLMAGDFEAAIQETTLALERREVGKTLCNRANAYVALDRHAEAAKDLDRAIEMNASDAMAWLLRAQARIQAKDTPGARQAIDRAMALSGDDPEALLLEASIRWRESNLLGACDRCDAILRGHPDFAEAYAMRGAFRVELGNPEGGIEDLKKYLKLAADVPGAETIRRQLGEAWAELAIQRAAEAGRLQGDARTRALSSAVDAVRESLREAPSLGSVLREEPGLAPLRGLEEFQALFR